MKNVVKRVNRAISTFVLVTVYLFVVGLIHFFYKIYISTTGKNKKTEWKTTELLSDVTWESLSSPY